VPAATLFANIEPFCRVEMMRTNRPLIFAIAAIGVCLITWLSLEIVHGWRASQNAVVERIRLAQKPARNSGDLSSEDETKLRAIVSQHVFLTANWAPGGGNPYDPTIAYRVLLPPRGISEFYARKPLGTLRTLKQIVASGTTADAHAAAAYAHAVVGYANDEPVALLTAHTYSYFPTPEEFDDKNPVIPKTYRERALEELEGLIANLQKRQKEKG
jgi:hypothetical protein